MCKNWPLPEQVCLDYPLKMWSRSTEGKTVNELIEQNLEVPQKGKQAFYVEAFANIFCVLEMQSEFDKNPLVMNEVFIWRILLFTY